MKVLVISASMGGGHDGAARELQTRLEARGDEAQVVDFLAAMPLHFGTLVRLGYEWQLRLAPWAYEATYRLWYLMPFLCRPLVSFIALITNGRIRRWCRESQPDVIVSTYPLSSLVLGRDRRRGRLVVPVATFITDFAVHPLWVHPNVDEHLCVHPQSAATAARQTGGPAAAPGPLVPTRFTEELPDRAAARARFGIGADERIVLLVAGSWGVGDVEHTFDDVVATGRYTPLAVCGRNERLRRRVEARGVGRVMGWTDEMPALMAAADVLVQNAGGLTCMEAFAAGLPVVSYRPIAGHGRENALDMARAGVAAYATKEPELGPALDEATGSRRAEMVAAAHAMFSGNAADDVARLATPAAAPTAPQARHRSRRVTVAAAASLAMLYAVFTTGVETATAHGLGVLRGSSRGPAAYIAVRLGPGSIQEPGLAEALVRAHATAIVNGALATSEAGAVHRLSAAGVDVANGGWGRHVRMQWRRAHADLKRAGHAIEAATGARVRAFIPVRRIDGFDLAWARAEHERVVIPSRVLTEGNPDQVRAGAIYVIDARRADGEETLRMLAALEQRLAAGRVLSAPLADLT